MRLHAHLLALLLATLIPLAGAERRPVVMSDTGRPITLPTADQIVLPSAGPFLTTIIPTATADRDITLPDASIIVSGSASALTSGRVAFTAAGGLLADSANLSWNGTTLAVTGGISASDTIVSTKAVGSSALRLFSSGGASSTVDSLLGDLLRHEAFGYASSYSAATLGSESRAVALAIDVSTIAGGSFTGTGLDILAMRTARFAVPNAGGTDWVYPLKLSGGVASIASPALDLGDSAATFNVEVVLPATGIIYAGGTAANQLRCYFDASNSYWRAPSGGHIWQNSAASNRMTLSDAGVLNVTATTSSTNTTTGSLINAGGFGNAGAANIGGTLTVSGTTATISSGTGTPESAVTAPVGSLFLRTDGGASTTLYVKESGSGNTGWVAK